MSKPCSAIEVASGSVPSRCQARVPGGSRRARCSFWLRASFVALAAVGRGGPRGAERLPSQTDS
eukprot:2336911-Pyramimonas_sp.AAC.1